MTPVEPSAAHCRANHTLRPFLRALRARLARAGAPRERPDQPGLGASLLAALAGVLVAFGTFGVLAVVVAAVGMAIGVPLDLAPGDWRRLETAIAAAAALGALLAYLFGGYVAARLGGRDGLQHGLRVFTLAVTALAALGLLGLAMAGPASIGAHLYSGGTPPVAAAGVQVWQVAVKTAIWSLLAMLVGSVIGGVLGERAHRRQRPDAAGGS
jgi:MFS family permease